MYCSLLGFSSVHLYIWQATPLFWCDIVNTKIWHRKESELWAQLGEKIRPEEERFLQKDSAKELAVGNWLPFGKETVCADFAGLRDDVVRAEGTNGRISDRA
jgi:hypothetical protein